MSGRKYSIGDTIPGHGVVVEVWSTAYKVLTNQSGTCYAAVPFYGPNGVDHAEPVKGLVTFADGSRYGGAR